MSGFKKSEYVLTGSTQSGIIYLYSPCEYVLKKFKGKGFFCFIDGFLKGFFNKKMISRMKDDLLGNSADQLDGKFRRWKKTWQKHQELYRLATKSSNAWRENWEKLDKLNGRFWAESYQIETIDSFGTELNKIISNNLKKIGLDGSLTGKLICPARLTVLQKMMSDREKVKKGKMPKNVYLRRYWYCHGDWNGGELLTKELFKKDIKQKEIKTDFKSLKKIHRAVDKKLDKPVLNLVRLLRILSLWRDERKVLMQKINLGYERVIKDAANELKVDSNLVKCSLLKEVDEIPVNREKFVSRRKAGVAVFDFSKDKEKETIVDGNEAFKIINRFCQAKGKSMIRGTSASKGLTVGRIMIVLRKNDFPKFKKGMILVTTMTRPEYYPLMRIAKAVVTDEGGITSHAAIISRELGIPCVIGTQIATSVLKDGQLVEVNADHGTIKILK